MNTPFKEHLIKAGVKIISYPNHEGESLEGVILELHPTRNELAVDYNGYGRATLKPNGRLLSDKIDTSLDIRIIITE